MSAVSSYYRPTEFVVKFNSNFQITNNVKNKGSNLVVLVILPYVKTILNLGLCFLCLRDTWSFIEVTFV